MSEKTRAELKEQIKIMNHNYQVIKEMHEKGYQYSVSEIKRLQDELDCTRKALELAITGLKNCKTRDHIGAVCRIPEYVDKVLEQITTALEQKD